MHLYLTNILYIFYMFRTRISFFRKTVVRTGMYKQHCLYRYVLIYTVSVRNKRLPEEGTSGLKHVEDIVEIKTLYKQRRIFWCKI